MFVPHPRKIIKISFCIDINTNCASAICRYVPYNTNEILATRNAVKPQFKFRFSLPIYYIFQQLKIAEHLWKVSLSFIVVMIQILCPEKSFFSMNWNSCHETKYCHDSSFRTHRHKWLASHKSLSARTSLYWIPTSFDFDLRKSVVACEKEIACSSQRPLWTGRFIVTVSSSVAAWLSYYVLRNGDSRSVFRRTCLNRSCPNFCENLISAFPTMKMTVK